MLRKVRAMVAKAQAAIRNEAGMLGERAPG